MKLAAVQINPTIGDCAGNTAKIQQAIEKAQAQGVSLAIFPELAVTGYPPQDLLDSPALALAARQSIDSLAKLTSKIAVVVGFVEKNPNPIGKPFFNSAALLRGGKVEAIYRKHLLPSYDVFDEERYFEAGTEPVEFEHEGKKFAITICEDAWNFPGFLPRRYATQPLDRVRKAQVDWVLNLSASPFHLGKPAVREKLFSAIAALTGSYLLFCNQVGANDDLIFDGGSTAVDPAGKVLARASFFKEDFLVLENARGETRSQPTQESEWTAQALELGIADYVRKSKGQGVCLGLSGGVDSSIVAVLAARALGPDKVKGVLLPSRFTSDASNEDALELAASLKIRTATLPIEGLFTAATETLQTDYDKLAPLTLENLQPRLRMTFLMAVANNENLLLLNTANKSEIGAGYATVYGDAVGALAIIGDLTKHQVYALGRYLNENGAGIPVRVLERAPSAELREDQKDEDSLPPYPVLDPMIETVVERSEDAAALRAKGLAEEHIQNFLKRYRGSEYKRRQFPPILRVSSHAFGRGRRMPIACSPPW